MDPSGAHPPFIFAIFSSKFDIILYTFYFMTVLGEEREKILISRCFNTASESSSGNVSNRHPSDFVLLPNKTMQVRPTLSSFLASVVRRAHQWIATTKLMGMILSVLQYLFSNPRSPLLSNMKTQQETKTVEDKNRSSSTIEKKDTSSKVDPPRILSVRFLLSI